MYEMLKTKAGCSLTTAVWLSSELCVFIKWMTCFGLFTSSHVRCSSLDYMREACYFTHIMCRRHINTRRSTNTFEK